MNLVEEILFWSTIMRDHGEFMITALSSREKDVVINAQNYKNIFIALGNDAKLSADSQSPGGGAVLALKSMTYVINFINFKRYIMARLLKCNIEINLPPTFINHMINEAMEFYKVLYKSQNAVTVNRVIENINLHKVWLPDASGHAAFISASLDPVESELIKEAEKFKKEFDNLNIKAVELGTMLERTWLDNGSLERLNEEAELKIKDFICFLQKIFELREKCKTLGFTNPLTPNHMMREETYYLTRLKELGVKQYYN